MRTRILPELTNYEVEQYLERNDLIFIPVGTVELHGSMPLNCEYVVAEALAREMAEQADGLVLTGLQYFFPGATTIGKGTVYVSPRDGSDYLKVISKSLLRQGFRRQVYLSMHGPSHMTISPMIVQFFDEEKVPLLYIDIVQVMFQKIIPALNKMDPEKGKAFMSNPENMMFGAYGYIGRQNEIPLDLGIPDMESKPGFSAQWIDDLALAPTSAFTGWYYGDASEHGAIKALTAEERNRICAENAKWIKELVRMLDIPKVVDSLQKLDKYEQEVVIPKFGNWLP